MIVIFIFVALLSGVHAVDTAPVPHFVTPCFGQPIGATCTIERASL